MSKIGKISISIPEKVKVTLNGGNLQIEGPLGKNNLTLDTNIFDLNINEGKEVSIKPKIINQNSKRIWGLNRSLINNAIEGINTGYSKTLELTGVGFRAAVKGKFLNLQMILVEKSFHLQAQKSNYKVLNATIYWKQLLPFDQPLNHLEHHIIQ